MQVAAQALSIIWGGLARLIKGDVSGAFEHLQTKAGEIAATATATQASLAGIWGGGGEMDDAVAVFVANQQKATKALKDFNTSALAGKNAVSSFIDAQNKSLVAQQAEIATFGMMAGAKEALKLQLQALTIATQNHTTISAAQQAQLDITKQKTIEYGQTLMALQLVQSNLTPTQTYQQELFKIQTLYDNGRLSAEQYGIAMDNAAQRANTTWAQAGESIAGSFAGIAGAFGKESSKMAMAAKVFGVIQGTISMFTGAAKALELPFPANIAAVAAVLAKGASLVASIRSQSVPTGFALGGLVTGPGSGVSDSIPAMLSNGEFVMNAEATSRNRSELEAMNSGRSAAAPNVVNLSIPIATTRDALRSIIEGLNDMFADGYKLNVVPA